MPSTITVKSPKAGREMTVTKEFGNDLDESVELFGADTVFNKFKSQVETDLGNSVRRLINNDAPEADILAHVEGYKPGVTARRVGVKKIDIAALAAKLKDKSLPKEERQQAKAALEKFIEDQRRREQEALEALGAIE